MLRRLSQLALPVWSFRVSARTDPWFRWPALALIAAGISAAFLTPIADYREAGTFRIAYVQLPSLWLSLLIYAAMAAASVLGLAKRIRMAHAATAAAAPIGAAFTVLALATGLLWNKSAWGTYWVWDARLTLELVLLFLYLGYVALLGAFAERDRDAGDRAGAVLAILGAIDVPIILYSLQWWSSTSRIAGFSLAGHALIPATGWPLFPMTIGFFCYAGWLMTLRLRIEILRRGGNRTRRAFR